VFGADEINFLTPEKGNIHKFTALEDTAILDILLPNYNEDDHYCNYYIEETEFEERRNGIWPNIENNKEEKSKTKNGKHFEEEKSPDEDKNESQSDNKSPKKVKLPGPGEMTTVIYSLPPLEQEIELLPYRGEKFDVQTKKSSSNKESNIKNTEK